MQRAQTGRKHQPPTVGYERRLYRVFEFVEGVPYPRVPRLAGREPIVPDGVQFASAEQLAERYGLPIHAMRAWWKWQLEGLERSADADDRILDDDDVAEDQYHLARRGRPR